MNDKTRFHDVEKGKVLYQELFFFLSKYFIQHPQETNQTIITPPSKPPLEPLSSLLNSETTPPSQPGAQEIQRPNPADTGAGQAGQKADALADAQGVEHGGREQDGGEGDGGAAEVVGGEEGGGVGGVGQGHVEEDALQDDEDADGEDADGEHGADPVDGGFGRPALRVG